MLRHLLGLELRCIPVLQKVRDNGMPPVLGLIIIEITTPNNFGLGAPTCSKPLCWPHMLPEPSEDSLTENRRITALSPMLIWCACACVTLACLLTRPSSWILLGVTHFTLSMQCHFVHPHMIHGNACCLFLMENIQHHRMYDQLVELLRVH